MSDARPAQAFAKFTRTLANLERTMTLPENNEDFRNSAILAFLLAQETAWKAIKWVLKDKIAIEVAGPKPVLQEAFLQGWLGNDDKVWLSMAQDRNLVAHTYNEEQALEVYDRVKDYVIALRKAHDLLTEKYPDLLMI
jgi:nucleotidyltransferase substrate binding protein (TIGR01987 family)